MPARWLGIVLVAAIVFGCSRMTGVDDGEDAGGEGGPGDSSTARQGGTADTSWADGGDGNSGTGGVRIEDAGESVGDGGESGVEDTGLPDGGSEIGELSFVASASVEDDVAVVIPSEARAGDLAVFVDAYTGYLPPGAFPDGWSPVSNVFASVVVEPRPPRSSGFRTIVSYKILQSGDAGKRVYGTTAEFGARSKVLLVFRASRSVSTVSVKSLSEEATFDYPAPQTVTASNGDVPLVVIASYATTGSIQGVLFNPSEDDEIAIGLAFSVRYKIFNASPSDVSVDLGRASGTLQSFYLEVF